MFFSLSTIYILLLIFSPDPLYSREYSRIYQHLKGSRASLSGAWECGIAKASPKRTPGKPPAQPADPRTSPRARGAARGACGRGRARRSYAKKRRGRLVVWRRQRTAPPPGPGTIFPSKKLQTRLIFWRIFSNAKVRRTAYILKEIRE